MVAGRPVRGGADEQIGLDPQHLRWREAVALSKLFENDLGMLEPRRGRLMAREKAGWKTRTNPQTEYRRES